MNRTSAAIERMQVRTADKKSSEPIQVNLIKALQKLALFPRSFRTI